MGLGVAYVGGFLNELCFCVILNEQICPTSFLLPLI